MKQASQANYHTNAIAHACHAAAKKAIVLRVHACFTGTKHIPPTPHWLPCLELLMAWMWVTLTQAHTMV